MTKKFGLHFAFRTFSLSLCEIKVIVKMKSFRHIVLVVLVLFLGITDCFAISTDNKAGKKSDIAPILGDIAWQQEEPFNILCPKVDGDRTVIGCVSAALSQIFMYYQKPVERTVPITNVFDGTCRKPVRYEWGKMRHSYNKPYKTEGYDESDSAVANLCYDLSVALQTVFGTTGSDMKAPVDSVPIWLSRYFGYNGVRVYRRSGYSYENFVNIIDYELEHNRPVVLLGKRVFFQDGKIGHAFICDGRKDGLYHFNWGDGSGDAVYASLYELVPPYDESGTPMCGYTNDLYVLAGLDPDAEMSDPELYATYRQSPDGNDSYSCLITSKYQQSGELERDYVSVPFGCNVLFNVFAHPNSNGGKDCEFAVGYLNEDNQIVCASKNVILYDRESVNFYYLDVVEDFKIGKVYRMMPIYRLVGSSDWKLMEGSDNIFFELKLKDSKTLEYKVSTYDVDVYMKGFDSNAVYEVDKSTPVSIEVKNNGDLEYDYRIDIKAHNIETGKSEELLSLDNVWLGTGYGYEISCDIPTPKMEGTYDIFAYTQSEKLIRKLARIRVSSTSGILSPMLPECEADEKNVVYGFDGRLRGNNINGLKGLYIINGKKVIK